MSRSNSDVRKREYGNQIKIPVKKKDESEIDVDGSAPEDGCQFYGDVEQMARKCPGCVDKNCY